MRKRMTSQVADELARANADKGKEVVAVTVLLSFVMTVGDEESGLAFDWLMDLAVMDTGT